MSEKPWKPTREQIQGATDKTVPDVIAPRLDVLFCGINPGLYTAAVGHHFARPGNRFWPALHKSGFTPRELSPFEECILPSLGLGITNLVTRATNNAAQLTKMELEEGVKKLEEKVIIFQPRVVAILGYGAYRIAFGDSGANPGLQNRKIGNAIIWTLPNPSGLNASYQIKDLVALFHQLYLWLHPDNS